MFGVEKVESSRDVEKETQPGLEERHRQLSGTDDDAEESRGGRLSCCFLTGSDRERIEGEDGLVGLEIVVERGKIAEARSYLNSGVSWGRSSFLDEKFWFIARSSRWLDAWCPSITGRTSVCTSRDRSCPKCVCV